MKRAFVMTAMVGLSACASPQEKKEVSGPLEVEVVDPSSLRIEAIVKKCKEEYKPFFVQEVCVHNERGKYDDNHYVPEVIGFAKDFGSKKYQDLDIEIYTRDIADKISKNKKICLKAFPLETDEVVFKCSEYALYKVLNDSEQILKSDAESDVRKTKELFYYFFLLNLWLNTL